MCSKVLLHFVPNLPIAVVANSSGYRIGAVSNHNINGQERPITLTSKTLTKTEENCPQLEKEALDIVFALMQAGYRKKAIGEEINIASANEIKILLHDIRTIGKVV